MQPVSVQYRRVALSAAVLGLEEGRWKFRQYVDQWLFNEYQLTGLQKVHGKNGSVVSNHTQIPRLAGAVSDVRYGEKFLFFCLGLSSLSSLAVLPQPIQI